ncbi:MAG TPA: ATP-binding protein, partial [Prolixibacteraceae bacterium]
QVLLNLISNASKFTEEGTVIVTAEVQTGSDNRQEVLVSVTDTGPGISEEDQSKLFLAFSQVDSSPTRKTGGTGLGLSICQRLVDLHGGQIGVHSKLGEGSSFYFTIPLFHQSNQVNSAVSNRTILCVETDPRIITIYERFLQAKSYEIVPVVNPNNVLEMASRLMPLAIILDVDSLGTNKWSILAKLKDDPTTKNIPVIICNIAEQEEKGYCLNAADYLLKPIRAEDLLGALTRLNSENKISEILIIDNSVEELDRIEKILLEDGLLHPMLAIGLEKGLEALTNQPPHAIILSMMLPELEEIALLEKINLTSSMQNIPVIFMTPKLPDEDQLTRLEKLTEHYSRKGMVSETQLFIEIEKHLRSYEQT